MLRSYVLAPDTVRRFLRRVYWRFELIAVLSISTIALYMAFLAGPVRWDVAGPMVGIIALAYFFVIFFYYRQQLRQLYSARYEIDDSSITYRQFRQQPLHINRASIIAVTERPDGIWIETTDPRTNLFIPHGLVREGDKDFYRTLAAWVTIKPVAQRRSLEAWLILFALVVSLLVMILANSLWIVMPLGVFMIAFGSYTEHRLTRTHSVPISTVRLYSLAFSFIVIVMLTKGCLIGITLLAHH